jgi:hypothetical protein
MRCWLARFLTWIDAVRDDDLATSSIPQIAALPEGNVGVAKQPSPKRVRRDAYVVPGIPICLQRLNQALDAHSLHRNEVAQGDDERGATDRKEPGARVAEALDEHAVEDADEAHRDRLRLREIRAVDSNDRRNHQSCHTPNVRRPAVL